MRAAPSFLFLITDQHRPDHTGFGGSGIVKTPNLDALASRSMRFDRAHVANPICMPNRSTILTGRQPSVHGTRYNGIPLDWGSETFVRVLRDQGFRTASIGKSHLQNMGQAADLISRFFPSERDARRSEWPKGWDAYEDGERHRHERVEMPADFYGFEHVDLTVNHSDLCSGHYYQWLLEQGVDPTALQGPGQAKQRYEDWWQVYQTAIPEELYPTSYVTDQSIRWLEEQEGADQPFFLWCSYPDPHHPFTPPGRFYEMYDPDAMPVPETFADPHTDSMDFYRYRLKFRGSQRAFVDPFAPTEAQVRHAMAAEFGMISMIDEGVGRILACLERTGRAEDTVIVFTSDHGDMFGDHGMMLKAGMHYEGCTRVPLLIHRPGGQAGVCSELAGSLDLAQTLLELAGCEAYHGMQGHSLVPLLEGGDGVRDDLVVEEDEIFDMARLGQPLRMRTLITRDARLTLYRGSDHGELFDLARDPHEMDNLFAKPEGRSLRAELSERLARRLMETADSAPIPTHLA